MTEQTMKAGDFCWVELLTPDIDKALTFYQPLLDWDAESFPTNDGDSYTMLKTQDQPIAGAFQFNEEMKATGMPPHWSSYVRVENADEMAEKAEQLGGQILRAPFDVTDYGRMAVIADPTGATLCLWQPKQPNDDMLPKDTPGTFGWNELMTTDIETAAQFYSNLFNWQADTQEMEHGTVYTTFINQDTPAAGMLQIKEEWGDVPPHWGVYFTVEDCDETVAQAEELGGNILYDPIEVPTVGRFTMIEDPQGAHFSIIEFATEEDAEEDTEEE